MSRWVYLEQKHYGRPKGDPRAKRCNGTSLWMVRSHIPPADSNVQPSGSWRPHQFLRSVPSRCLLVLVASACLAKKPSSHKKLCCYVVSLFHLVSPNVSECPFDVPFCAFGSLVHCFLPLQATQQDQHLPGKGSLHLAWKQRLTFSKPKKPTMLALL